MYLAIGVHIRMYVNGKLTWNNCIDSLANKLKPPMSSAYYNIILKSWTAQVKHLYYTTMIPHHTTQNITKLQKVL